MNKIKIEIYTDGSCHTDSSLGAWAAILFCDGEKIELKGTETDTTHNRMELLAVINAIEYADTLQKQSLLTIYTDSQYVHLLPERMAKLKNNHFLTKKGTSIQNEDLVKHIILLLETHCLEFVKVKAHQKKVPDSKNSPTNFNREVDILARDTMRQWIKNNAPK